MHLLNIYLNIVFGIALGLLLDRVVDLMGLSSILRIFVQFNLNLLVYLGLSMVYTKVGFVDLESSIFFVSVFLGSQKHLFGVIHELI